MSNSEAGVLKSIRDSLVLPTVPAVALAILRLAQDPRVSIERMAESLEKDPALAGKVLRFANSSYYAPTSRILSLPQAIIRIGIRRVKMLALSFSLLDVCGQTGAHGFDFPAYWQRSLTMSVAARRIAERSTRNKVSDQAFIAALLADVGCPVLAGAFPAQYRSVEKLVPVGQRELVELETNFIGVAHPRASAMILEAWRLPGEFVEAVAAHHDLSLIEADAAGFPVAIVLATAADLADIITLGVSERRISRLAANLRQHFAFTAQHIDLLLKDLGPEIERVGALLNVPLPQADQIHAQAKAEILKLAMQEDLAGAGQGGPDTAGTSAVSTPGGGTRNAQGDGPTSGRSNP